MAGMGPFLLPLTDLALLAGSGKEGKRNKVLHFLGKGRILSRSTSLTSIAAKKCQLGMFPMLALSSWSPDVSSAGSPAGAS